MQSTSANKPPGTLPNFNSDLFLSLPDSVPGLIACVDCNMTLRYCNQAFREWSFYDESVAGLSFPILVGNSLFNQVQLQMGHVLVGHRVRFQATVHKADENIQYFDVSLCPQWDEKGRVDGFVFHAADVTQQAELERGLSDYFENASICLHWVNEKGIIVWANPTELKTLGYEKSEYIGRHISEFHAKPAIINDILTRLANNEILRNVEAEVVRKDGTIRNVLINSSVLREGEKFVHTRCFTVDITEQKRAALAAKQTEDRFRQMANLVPLVIWTTDKDGQCDFVNERWLETTGTSLNEALGNGWLNLIHPQDREKIQASWLSSVKGRRTFEAKMRLLNSNGKYTATYINCQPQVDASGELTAYIGIMQDIASEEEVKGALERIVLERTSQLSITNQKLSAAKEDLQRKNAELVSINNQLSSFAHIASHDLQEPLRKIQTLLSFLFEIEGNKFSEKGNALFNRIADSSRRMRALIQDLLAYASNEIATANLEVLDLREIINEVIGELETRVNEKEAMISIGDLPAIHGVRFQIHQLFLNLLSNALKFSKPGTRPVIEINSKVVTGNLIPGSQDHAGDYNLITVKDKGIGFEPEYRDKIFEMFKRLHSNQKYEGTGIGLAICKKVVDNHKGSIVAESEPGSGTTFSILLPVSTDGN